MNADQKRAERTRAHNLALLKMFEREAISKGHRFPAVAIVIGASGNGVIQVGVDTGLPREALIELLMIAADELQGTKSA